MFNKTPVVALQSTHKVHAGVCILRNFPLKILLIRHVFCLHIRKVSANKINCLEAHYLHLTRVENLKHFVKM